jgi:HSP20 family molecular chaperone IbpA
MSNRDPFGQMWSQALALLDQADQMQRQFFQVRPGAAHAHSGWEPPVDIIENASALLVVVALPGVARESISAALERGHLAVAATRALPGAQAEAVIRRMEIPHGRFERRIALPQVPLKLAESHFSGGCLYVTLQKEGT